MQDYYSFRHNVIIYSVATFMSIYLVCPAAILKQISLPCLGIRQGCKNRCEFLAQMQPVLIMFFIHFVCFIWTVLYVIYDQAQTNKIWRNRYVDSAHIQLQRLIQKCNKSFHKEAYIIHIHTYTYTVIHSYIIYLVYMFHFHSFRHHFIIYIQQSHSSRYILFALQQSLCKFVIRTRDASHRGYMAHEPNFIIIHIWLFMKNHYSDVIMSTMASQITGATFVYSIVCSGADQRKHQNSPSLAFVRGIHRWPVNAPQKGPVTRKMFPFDDVIKYDHI